jgi:SAM-dependent methyltransferase
MWFNDRLYTHFAWGYDAATWFASGGLWYRWTFVAERYTAEEPMLEVGFGRGRLLARLLNDGHQAAGIDRSPQMVRGAKRHLHKAELTLPLIQGEGQALPFPDASLGTLITTFPAPYVYDSATGREFVRVLRPGGRWVWVSAIFARRPTLRVFPIALLTYLSRMEDSWSPTTRSGAVGALSAALGVSRTESAWRPPVSHLPLTGVWVEQVPVGPTAVHVAVLEKDRHDSNRAE